MDYEKKYKEALKDMRAIYPNLKGDAKLAVEHAFPELKESGDEWFIKELQGFLESYGADYFGTGEWQKFHVWLENQKEQEHPCDSAQFEEGFKTGYELGLRKKKEQKSVEINEEDERIRRTLVEYFEPSGQLDLVRGVPIQKIRDWLEKQKEPHYTKRNALFDKCVANCDPAIMKRVSDEVDEKLKEQKMINLEIPAGDVAPAEEDGSFDEDDYLESELSAFLQNYDEEYDDDAAVSDVAKHFYELGKKVKQKPAEWSEDYREEDLRTRFAFYTYKNEEDDGVLYLSNVFVEEASRNKGFGTKILAAAEKVAETLGAINIRLKVKQNSPANAWYRKHGYGYMTFEDGYDWLEKTLEYIKPIKSGWSEEDEKKRRNLMSLLANMRGDRITEETYQKYYPWLKSLRPYLKPSEEQMEEQPQVADASKMEQPEIDFEQALYHHFGQVKDFTLGMRIAAYFYELGLKARKED